MRLLFLFFSLLGLISMRADELDDAVRQALAEVKQGRIGRGNLESLHISRFCLPSKKDEIGEAWESLGENLRRDRWKAVIERKKILGDLAAVSVALHGPVAPDEARLVVLGLRQIDGTWKMAPVFGSFENAGLGFEAEQARQRQEMEDWMALERGVGLGRVIATAEKNFETELLIALSEEDREKATPDEVVEKFLNAAHAGRAKEMLRWLGYADQMDSEDQKRVTRVISRGLQNEDEQRQWWMLHSGDTLSVKLASRIDDDEAYVVVGFYNPVIQAGQQMQAHRFSLIREKKGGAWYLVLPGNFSHADESSEEFWRARNQDVDDEDSQLLPHMAAILAEESEKKRAKSPEKALDRVMAAMRSGDFSKLMPYFVWKEEETVRERRMSLERVGMFWQQYKETSELSVTKIDLWKESDHALGILRLSSEKSYPQIDLAPLWLSKDADGWGMVANDKIPDNTTEGALYIRYGKELKGIKNSILHENFGDKLVTYKTDHGAVNEAQARELLKNYCLALQTERLGEVLPFCAVLDTKNDFYTHLKHVDNTMRSGFAQENGEDALRAEVSLGENWAAGSVSSKSGIYVETGYPVILIVPTEKGPRVLLDADLWVETNKAKRLRNMAAMHALEKNLPAGKLAVMKKLVAKQQEKMAKLIEAKQDPDENR